MPVSPRFLLVLYVGLIAAPGAAAELQPHACLTKAEQRAAVAEHRAIPLAQAVKTLHARGHRAEGLAYVLTLLPRSGKVARLTVDAANGEVINGR
jgi:hypothetical protein